MPLHAYLILAAGWLLWFAPFPLNRWNFKTPATIDHRARWGIALELVAYSLLWQTNFWTRSPGAWRIALSILFLSLASILSWTGVRTLGGHLRVDAALSSDHQVVRAGPYQVVLHPISSSMCCILLGTAVLTAPVLL